MRAATTLLGLFWLFGPLGVWLAQEYVGHWLPTLVGLVWMTQLASALNALMRPGLARRLMPWLVGPLFVAGVILLPWVPSLVLAVGWIFVAMWTNRYLQSHTQLIGSAIDVAKVLSYKSLVETGMDDKVAAAHINASFTDQFISSLKQMPREEVAAALDAKRDTLLGSANYGPKPPEESTDPEIERRIAMEAHTLSLRRHALENVLSSLLRAQQATDKTSKATDQEPEDAVVF